MSDVSQFQDTVVRFRTWTGRKRMVSTNVRTTLVQTLYQFKLNDFFYFILVIYPCDVVLDEDLQPSNYIIDDVSDSAGY